MIERNGSRRVVLTSYRHAIDAPITGSRRPKVAVGITAWPQPDSAVRTSRRLAPTAKQRSTRPAPRWPARVRKCGVAPHSTDGLARPARANSRCHSAQSHVLPAWRPSEHIVSRTLHNAELPLVCIVFFGCQDFTAKFRSQRFYQDFWISYYCPLLYIRRIHRSGFCLTEYGKISSNALCFNSPLSSRYQNHFDRSGKSDCIRQIFTCEILLSNY